MNQNNFRMVFNLTRKQPWLEDKFSTLDSLLYNECQSDAERDLIVDLLHKFTYISASNYSSLTNELAESIVSDPDLTDDTTQIVSMTADYNSDSGQFVLYWLKPILERLGWRDHITVTNFQRSLRAFNKNNNKHVNIVLVDEFVGSGKTVEGRVSRLRQIYKEQGIEITVRVKVIVSSTVGIKLINDKKIPFETMIEINRGISDNCDSATAKTKISTMIQLESLLSSNYNDRPLPSLGYGGTESLYVRDDGNTPNSVFPIFWWPIFSDGKSRETLLTRAMGDA
ncbi:hypothetical protein KUW04_08895 [Halomonas denitrificans]|nr:hypothetical protein [Halomonas denitrificans]